MRFCRDPCRREFEADLAAPLARQGATMFADQLSVYPLTTSVVRGLPLERRPEGFGWGNLLFRETSAQECDRVLASPDSYIQALDRERVRTQRSRSRMPTNGPVQGDILDSNTPVQIVDAQRMIRVGCERCVRVVRARPSPYLSMVEFANRETSARAGSAAHP